MIGVNPLFTEHKNMISTSVSAGFAPKQVGNMVYAVEFEKYLRTGAIPRLSDASDVAKILENSYEINGAGTGYGMLYTWQTEGSNPCGACVARVGKVYDLRTDFPLPLHLNCKCVVVFLGAGEASTMNAARKIELEKIKKEKLDKFKKSGQGIKNALEAKNMSFVEIYNAVKTGGKWDYKYGDPAMEHVGNYNYGMVMAGKLNATVPVPKAVAEQILLRGAGAYQKYGDVITKIMDGKLPNSITGKTYQPEFGGPLGKSPYGDDPVDQKYIQEGVNDWYANFTR